MNGFYSVFAPGGRKVADCGSLQDATTLVAMKGEGHYYQFTPFPGDIIDVSLGKQLPTNQIVDLGGKWDDPIPEGVDPWNLGGRGNELSEGQGKPVRV